MKSGALKQLNRCNRRRQIHAAWLPFALLLGNSVSWAGNEESAAELLPKANCKFGSETIRMPALDEANPESKTNTDDLLLAKCNICIPTHDETYAQLAKNRRVKKTMEKFNRPPCTIPLTENEPKDYNEVLNSDLNGIEALERSKQLTTLFGLQKALDLELKRRANTQKGTKP